MRRLGRTQRAREEECTGVCCLLLIDKARAKDYIYMGPSAPAHIGAGTPGRVMRPHTMPSPVDLVDWDGGPSRLSAPDPPPGTPRSVWEEIGGLGPSAPAHIGAGAPGCWSKRKDLPYILLSLTLDLSINNKQHTPVHSSSLVLCVLP
jgi:hypothetical protein